MVTDTQLPQVRSTAYFSDAETSWLLSVSYIFFGRRLLTLMQNHIFAPVPLPPPPPTSAPLGRAAKRLPCPAVLFKYFLLCRVFFSSRHSLQAQRIFRGFFLSIPYARSRFSFFRQEDRSLKLWQKNNLLFLKSLCISALHKYLVTL